MMINETLNAEEGINFEQSGIGAVIMDMQAKLLDAVNASEELKRSMILKVEIMKALGVPTCFTEQVPEKLGSTIPEIINHCRDYPIFNKSSFSAFGCDQFNQWIKDCNVSHLLVSGIETPICIYQTCIDALRKNLKVTIISDCIGARREKDAETVIHQLRSFGCYVVPIEAVIYAILRNSSHVNFRTISKIVSQRG